MPGSSSDFRNIGRRFESPDSSYSFHRPPTGRAKRPFVSPQTGQPRTLRQAPAPAPVSIPRQVAVYIAKTFIKPPVHVMVLLFHRIATWATDGAIVPSTNRPAPKQRELTQSEYDWGRKREEQLFGARRNSYQPQERTQAPRQRRSQEYSEDTLQEYGSSSNEGASTGDSYDESQSNHSQSNPPHASSTSDSSTTRFNPNPTQRTDLTRTRRPAIPPQSLTRPTHLQTPAAARPSPIQSGSSASSSSTPTNRRALPPGWSDSYTATHHPATSFAIAATSTTSRSAQRTPTSPQSQQSRSSSTTSTTASTVPATRAPTFRIAQQETRTLPQTLQAQHPGLQAKLESSPRLLNQLTNYISGEQRRHITHEQATEDLLDSTRAAGISNSELRDLIDNLFEEFSLELLEAEQAIAEIQSRGEAAASLSNISERARLLASKLPPRITATTTAVDPESSASSSSSAVDASESDNESTSTTGSATSNVAEIEEAEKESKGRFGILGRLLSSFFSIFSSSKKATTDDLSETASTHYTASTQADLEELKGFELEGVLDVFDEESDSQAASGTQTPDAESSSSRVYSATLSQLDDDPAASIRSASVRSTPQKDTHPESSIAGASTPTQASTNTFTPPPASAREARLRAREERRTEVAKPSGTSTTSTWKKGIIPDREKDKKSETPPPELKPDATEVRLPASNDLPIEAADDTDTSSASSRMNVDDQSDSDTYASASEDISYETDSTVDDNEYLSAEEAASGAEDAVVYDLTEEDSAADLLSDSTTTDSLEQDLSIDDRKPLQDEIELLEEQVKTLSTAASSADKNTNVDTLLEEMDRIDARIKSLKAELRTITPPTPQAKDFLEESTAVLPEEATSSTNQREGSAPAEPRIAPEHRRRPQTEGALKAISDADLLLQQANPSRENLEASAREIEALINTAKENNQPTAVLNQKYSELEDRLKELHVEDTPTIEDPLASLLEELPEPPATSETEIQEAALLQSLSSNTGPLTDAEICSIVAQTKSLCEQINQLSSNPENQETIDLLKTRKNNINTAVDARLESVSPKNLSVTEINLLSHDALERKIQMLFDDQLTSNDRDQLVKYQETLTIRLNATRPITIDPQLESALQLVNKAIESIETRERDNQLVDDFATGTGHPSFNEIKEIVALKNSILDQLHALRDEYKNENTPPERKDAIIAQHHVLKAQLTDINQTINSRLDSIPLLELSRAEINLLSRSTLKSKIQLLCKGNLTPNDKEKLIEYRDALNDKLEKAPEKEKPALRNNLLLLDYRIETLDLPKKIAAAQQAFKNLEPTTLKVLLDNQTKPEVNGKKEPWTRKDIAHAIATGRYPEGTSNDFKELVRIYAQYYQSQPPPWTPQAIANNFIDDNGQFNNRSIIMSVGHMLDRGIDVNDILNELIDDLSFDTTNNESRTTALMTLIAYDSIPVETANQTIDIIIASLNKKDLDPATRESFENFLEIVIESNSEFNFPEAVRNHAIATLAASLRGDQRSIFEHTADANNNLRTVRKNSPVELSPDLAASLLTKAKLLPTIELESNLMESAHPRASLQEAGRTQSETNFQPIATNQKKLALYLKPNATPTDKKLLIDALNNPRDRQEILALILQEQSKTLSQKHLELLNLIAQKNISPDEANQIATIFTQLALSDSSVSEQARSYARLIIVDTEKYSPEVRNSLFDQLIVQSEAIFATKSSTNYKNALAMLDSLTQLEIPQDQREQLTKCLIQLAFSSSTSPSSAAARKIINDIASGSSKYPLYAMSTTLNAELINTVAPILNKDPEELSQSDIETLSLFAQTEITAFYYNRIAYSLTQLALSSSKLSQTAKDHLSVMLVNGDKYSNEMREAVALSLIDELDADSLDELQEAIESRQELLDALVAFKNYHRVPGKYKTGEEVYEVYTPEDASRLTEADKFKRRVTESSNNEAKNILGTLRMEFPDIAATPNSPAIYFPNTIRTDLTIPTISEAISEAVTEAIEKTNPNAKKITEDNKKFALDLLGFLFILPASRK